MLRFVALIAFVLLVRTTDLAAQGQSGDSTQTRHTRRWAVSFSSAFSWGQGPVADYERAMVAAGLDEISECSFFCVGTIEHPRSRKSGWGSSIAVRYNFTPAFGLRASWSAHQMGNTRGYREPFLFVMVKGKMKTASLVAFVSPKGTLRFGAGPAVNFLRTERIDGLSSGEIGTNATKIGLVLEVGLTTPRNRRFFLDIGVQYRLSGSAQFGPFVATSRDGSTTATFEGESSVNHGVVAVGLGMRL